MTRQYIRKTRLLALRDRAHTSNGSHKSKIKTRGEKEKKLELVCTAACCCTTKAVPWYLFPPEETREAALAPRAAHSPQHALPPPRLQPRLLLLLRRHRCRHRWFPTRPPGLLVSFFFVFLFGLSTTVGNRGPDRYSQRAPGRGTKTDSSQSLRGQTLRRVLLSSCCTEVATTTGGWGDTSYVAWWKVRWSAGRKKGWLRESTRPDPDCEKMEIPDITPDPG